MLNVRSSRPHYWKAEALDSFDGLRWYRSRDTNEFGPEVAYTQAIPQGRWDYFEYNPNWDERIRFTVRSLSTELAVGAGVTLGVDGEGIRARPSGDGTTRLLSGRLERGDTYSVRAYAPNPTRAQLEGAPGGYSNQFAPYTAVQLPNPGDSALEPAPRSQFARELAAQERRTVFFPLRGNPAGAWAERSERMVRNSPYERMYDLAQQLTGTQESAYDAVKNVERYLQDNYTYSERVPTRRVPLMGFLYADERGYCQQFSGAMALMLRMAGIPARVSAGFAPGSYNKDTREYRVRDLDAHSWVEVWFTGIGWVPFDPTPARSPAESQSSALATSAAAADAGEVRASQLGVQASEPESGGSDSLESGGGGWVMPAIVVFLILLPPAAGALLVARRVRRVRELAPAELAAAQLSELRRALVRLGWDLPASTTLLGLERRLGRYAGPASEAYAEALRANRYDPSSPAAPSLRERRAVRRELTRGSFADRLRGLLAIPPGAPRS
jgi:transglutaminase-like putative cysteine protease